MYLLITSYILPFIGIFYFNHKSRKRSLSRRLNRALCNSPRNLSIIKSLLEEKADPNNFNNKFKSIDSPLCVSSIAHDSKAIELLLEHKANINQTDNTDRTPLSWSLPSLECINLLLEKKADVSHVNRQGNTVYLDCIALSSGTDIDPIIKTLLAYGAFPLHINKKGETALSIAKKNHAPASTIELLVAAEKQSFKKTKSLVYCSIFSNFPDRKEESFKKLSKMPLFDINLIEREIFSFLTPRQPFDPGSFYAKKTDNRAQSRHHHRRSTPNRG